MCTFKNLDKNSKNLENISTNQVVNLSVTNWSFFTPSAANFLLILFHLPDHICEFLHISSFIILRKKLSFQQIKLKLKGIEEIHLDFYKVIYFMKLFLSYETFLFFWKNSKYFLRYKQSKSVTLIGSLWNAKLKT